MKTVAEVAAASARQRDGMPMRCAPLMPLAGAVTEMRRDKRVVVGERAVAKTDQMVSAAGVALALAQILAAPIIATSAEREAVVGVRGSGARTARILTALWPLSGSLAFAISSRPFHVAIFLLDVPRSYAGGLVGRGSWQHEAGCLGAPIG